MFVHLHVHSQYSMLDGLSSCRQLAVRAKLLGHPALALTDHGVMHGAVEFAKACDAAGVKPIIGMEAYVSPLTRFHRTAYCRSSYHLTLLAMNNTGYANLCRLATIAQMEGFYYKPRIDLEALEQNSDGLIVLSGCGMSELHSLVLEDGPYPEFINWFVQRFPDRYFLELQEHDLPELTEVNSVLIPFGQMFKVPIVATNDVHYARQEDAAAHDALLCIQTGKRLDDTDRMRMNDDSYYIRPYIEMATLFPIAARENTLRIADMCNVDLGLGTIRLPKFQGPARLRSLVFHSAQQIFDDVPVGRLELELCVIESMGFDDYFLIIWDICQFAQREGIWYNCRGSANASLVAYCLGITNVNPLEFDLIFERFLNPDRITMPDIDLDFPDDRRNEILQYVIDTFGPDYIAQIGTFSHRRAKSALRDAARVLGVSLSDASVSSVALENAVSSRDLDIRSLPDDEQNLIHIARAIMDKVRHLGTHAAGVVVGSEPLIDVLPLTRPTRGSVSDVIGVTSQYDMTHLEDLGILKIDLLGSATLTTMHLACQLIAERYDVEYNLKNIPADDEKALDLIASGDVIGLFQVEGSGMRQTVMRMQPTRLDDIVAAISLYRPGPIEYIDDYIDRMTGRKEVTYYHPSLEPILGNTFGIIVYQEQIIRILTDIGGFSPAEADVMRRAISKKKYNELVQMRLAFTQGAAVPASEALAIFDDIVYFSRYGFNRAHAASYARVAMQTAYLKAHYPVEFMTALLNIERNNYAKVAVLIAECQQMSIQVLGPAVGGPVLFTIENGAIRFGLVAIKGLSLAAARTAATCPDELIDSDRSILERVGAFSDIPNWKELGLGTQMHEDGDEVQYSGTIASVRPYTTQSGAAMGFITLDDGMRLTLFPPVWKKYSGCKPGDAVTGQATASSYQGRMTFICRSLLISS